MRSSRRASASAIRLLARCQIQWCGSFISCTQRLDTREFHAVKDHVVEKTPITAQLWQMRKQESASDHTSGFVSIQASIVLKTVEQSRLSVRYSFRENSNLRDLYVDHTGNILIGKLFEDMDALAGNVAIKHCCDGDPQTKRLSLVTASLDEIIQKSPIPVNEDIILTGKVVWVGSSSLDVLVEVHTASTTDTVTNSSDQPSILLSSFFTYVARNQDTNKAAAVNHLLLSTAEEEALHAQRVLLATQRKAQRTAPSASTDAELGDTLQKLIESGNALQDMPALAHSNAVLMKLTGLENSVVCQPQNVNTGGRVFGGYIMHRAFDLAQATSYIFAGAYPVFLEVDKILFRKPVDIGDLLRLKSRVIYSEGASPQQQSLVVVEVVCQVVRPERATSFVSNTFHFVFGFPSTTSTTSSSSESTCTLGTVRLPRVLPVTAEEAQAMMIGRKATESSRIHTSL